MVHAYMGNVVQSIHVAGKISNKDIEMDDVCIQNMYTQHTLII